SPATCTTSATCSATCNCHRGIFIEGRGAQKRSETPFNSGQVRVKIIVGKVCTASGIFSADRYWLPAISGIDTTPPARIEWSALVDLEWIRDVFSRSHFTG